MADRKRARGRDRGKEALWRKRMRAQRSSGLAVRAYCRRDGLSEAAFYWWRRELARRDVEAKVASVRAASPVAGTGCTAGRASSPAQGAFVELTVSRSAARVSPVGGGPAPAVDVVLRGGRVLRVADAFSPETVLRLASLPVHAPGG